MGRKRKNEEALICPFRRYCTENCMLYDDESNTCVLFYLKWLVESINDFKGRWLYEE